MITRQDEEQIRLEKEYAEEQSRLNREHELALKDRELEVTKLQVKREYNWFRPILMFPIRLLLVLPLLVAVIRRHKVDSILEAMRRW